MKPDPKVEVINIRNHYVVFEGGVVSPIVTYLDLDDFVLDKDDNTRAFSCWCEHPAHGWLEVCIHDADEATTLH